MGHNTSPTKQNVYKDIWSTGCIFAELLLGRPIFPGESGIGQLVEIIKVLGTPSRQEIKEMNPDYTKYDFPQIQPKPLFSFFPQSTSSEALDCLSKILVYTPTQRLKPLEICAHPFFDELRSPNTLLPNGNSLPSLFDFSTQELEGVSPSVIEKLIPNNLPKNLSFSNSNEQEKKISNQK
eukprot:Anaeramoba_ignava/a482572_55.p2 GENE.a482572_55~~a482572_55.p2  ORF type:complete len:180 (+),score=56.00 a482572_55:666-1205(+)